MIRVSEIRMKNKMKDHSLQLILIAIKLGIHSKYWVFMEKVLMKLFAITISKHGKKILILLEVISLIQRQWRKS